MNKSTIPILSVIIVLANLITRGPDLYHFLSAKPDQWFTSQASWFDQIDLNTFFGAISLGQRGQLLFSNFYDTQNQNQAFIYPFYTLLGFLTQPFHASPQLIFHLAGIVTSTLLILVLYKLNQLFLKNSRLSLTALAVLVFGGGLGWVFFPKTLGLDLAMPGFNLMSALRSPHEAISSSLFLISVALIYTSSPLPLLITSFLAFIFHPHMAAPLLTLAAIYGFLKRRPHPIIAVAGSFALYYLIIGRTLLTNPAVSGLAHQESPPIPLLPFLIGYGIVIPFIIKGLKKHQFISLWFLAQVALVLLPIPYHGMMIRGLWYPAVLLAILGVKKQKFANWLIILTLPTTILVTSQRLSGAHTPRSIFITKDEGQAITTLNTIGKENDGVLASYRIANLVPAFANKRVWYGHDPLTPEFANRYAKAQAFFAGQIPEDQASEFLEKALVSWIIWGPEEQQLGSRLDFPYPNLTNPILTTPTTTLYQVQ